MSSERFCKESKGKAYFNRIYGFDDGYDWVLDVGRPDDLDNSIGYEFEGSIRVTAEAFKDVYTGLIPGSDGRVYVWEVLKAHIEQYWLFNLPGNSVIPYHDLKDKHIKKISRLTNVLHAIYNERDFRNIDGLDIGLKRKYEAKISTTGEYAEYLKTHTVYEVNQSSLYNTRSSSDDGIGMIRVISDRAKNIIRLYHRSRTIVDTEYNETIDYVFRSISNWELNKKHHLRVSALKTPISSAEIICGYHMKYLSGNLIGKGSDKIETALIEMHERFSKEKIQVDHLSENPLNEYSCFLAAMPDTLNSSLEARRTGIAAPYYWYNVHDWARGKVLVECGIDGTDYKKYYMFDDLKNPLEAELYQSCFNEFMSKVESDGYYAGKGVKAENNLFAYWANVQRAFNEDSPILALLKKPLEEFSTYVNGDLNDMPRICKNE